MNAVTTEIVTDNNQDQPESAGATQPQPSAAPTLESIVQAVCMDANYDSLKFVLRSDTGHDGE